MIYVRTISRAPETEDFCFGIDGPAPDTRYPGVVIPVAGWCVSATGRVRIRCGDTVLREVALDQSRPDVERHLNRGPLSTCGFHQFVSLLDCPEHAILTIEHVGIKTNRVREMARIAFSFRLRDSEVRDDLNPLLVTGLGRSGTTMLMNWLNTAPEIVMGTPYPFELRLSRYWFQVFRILTQPALPVDEYHPDHFWRNTDLKTSSSFVGPNPFYHGVTMQQGVLNTLWEERGPDEMLAFVKKQIETGYLALADAEKSPAYFAEKNHPDALARIQLAAYSGGREIFIVRDFRDTLASILSFNKKRGTQNFGMHKFANTEAYIRAFSAGPVHGLCESWQARQDTSLLVKYEDLLRQPEVEQDRIRQYTGAHFKGSEHGTTDAVLAEHRTATSSEASIGRWKEVLSSTEKSVCHDVLRPGLDVFGYD